MPHRDTPDASDNDQNDGPPPLPPWMREARRWLAAQTGRQPGDVIISVRWRLTGHGFESILPADEETGRPAQRFAPAPPPPPQGIPIIHDPTELLRPDLDTAEAEILLLLARESPLKGDVIGARLDAGNLSRLRERLSRLRNRVGLLGNGPGGYFLTEKGKEEADRLLSQRASRQRREQRRE